MPRFDAVYIYHPRGVETGGPELLHQLCALLREHGQPAFLVPLPGTEGAAPAKAYAHYDVAHAERVADAVGNAVILPEQHPLEPLFALRYATPVLWWLSLDKSPVFVWTLRRRNQVLLRASASVPILRKDDAKALVKLPQEAFERDRLAADTRFVHLAQSHYAQAAVSITLGVEVELLTDFAAPRTAGTVEVERAPRQIAYNAAKGGELVDLVARQAPADWVFTPIRGMSQTEVAQLLRTASVYLDLGEHPGRDRMPREAAQLGAVVVVGGRGSAVFVDDVPLPPEHVVSYRGSIIDNTIATLAAVFADVDAARAGQDDYRRWTAADRERFVAETLSVFELS